MSKIRKIFVTIFFIAISIKAHAGARMSDHDFVLPVARNEIKIMSYNVENLFDAVHDANKNDYEFLPLKSPEKKHCQDNKRSAQACMKTDWTAAKVAIKINQIKLAIAAQGELPDVLALVEVENPNIIKKLATTLGYSAYVMTDSPDQRGIDCAVLYRKEKLQLIEFVEKEIDKALFPTRNISSAIFRLAPALGGGVLAVLPNHWPSQGNPSKARLIVAEQLVQFIKSITAKYAKEEFYSVVVGDFNTLATESPSPLNDILLGADAKLGLIDARQYAIKEKNPFIAEMPAATYFYTVNDEWNEFDHVFVSSNLADGKGVELDAQSYRIHSPEFMTHKSKSGEKIPFRYDVDTTDTALAGYSDHFPVVVKLRN